MRPKTGFDSAVRYIRTARSRNSDEYFQGRVVRARPRLSTWWKRHLAEVRAWSGGRGPAGQRGYQEEGSMVVWIDSWPRAGLDGGQRNVHGHQPGHMAVA